VSGKTASRFTALEKLVLNLWLSALVSLRVRSVVVGKARKIPAEETLC